MNVGSSWATINASLMAFRTSRYCSKKTIQSTEYNQSQLEFEMLSEGTIV